MLAALLLTLLTPMASAGAVEVLPIPPSVADGQSTLRVALRVPGLQPEDRLRVRTGDGEITAVTRGLDGLVVVHVRPGEIWRADDLALDVSVRGGLKLDETVRVPVLAPARGTLAVSFSAPQLAAGAKDPVTVTLRPEGEHPLPDSARRLAVSASAGQLSAPERGADGAWTARWTPPPKVVNPDNVLFVATDLTAPGEVRGMATLALLAERRVEVAAPAGTQNILVIGDAQYGPAPADASGKVTFTARLDPRVTTATLQSVDLTARRTDSSVPLELGSSAQAVFAPVSPRLPTGQPLRLMLALVEADGRPWSGAAPTLSDGTEGRNEGQGWFSFAVTTPAEPGRWEVVARAEGAPEARFAADIVDAVPRVTVSSDPAALPADQQAFKVTVGLKDAAGRGLTKRALELDARGARPSGKLVDNGDGTYTQAYKLDGAELAEISVRPVLQATGLPPARLVAWAESPTLKADGKDATTVRVLALDAYGLPVPGVALSATAPVGDGAVALDHVTDKHGLARVEVRAGSTVGPAVLALDASGLRTSVLMWQRPPEVDPFDPDPVGDDATVEATARWRGAAPGIRVARVGADVGPPAALTLRSSPSYTTPGAAILVTVEVRDAAGASVPGVEPALVATPGQVGPATRNADGSVSFPVQLAAGQDGPVSLKAQAGDAVGSLTLPTLATIGTSEVAAPGTQPSFSGRPSDEAAVARARNDGATLRARGAISDTFYRNSAVDLSDATLLPPESVYSVPAGALGLAVEAELIPKAGPIVVDLRARFGAYRYTVAGGEPLSDVLYPVVLGARYRHPVGEGLHAYGGLALHAFDTSWFVYEDDTFTNATFSSRTHLGGRLAAGIQLERGPLGLRLELAETFAPLPAVSHLGGALDVEVYDLDSGALSFSMLAGLDQQHLRFEANDAGDRVRVRARQPYVGLGVGFVR